MEFSGKKEADKVSTNLRETIGRRATVSRPENYTSFGNQIG